MKSLALLCAASAASAAPALTPAPAPKKCDLERAHKAPHGPVLAAGAKPAPLVNLYNEHTHEWLAIDPARPLPNADRFLRDHFTNKQMAMSAKLVPIVLAAAAHFHSDVIDVVSGFRHPKYNLMLRKKGHQVARDSQHTHGDAIDFFLPNIATTTLHAWAKAQHDGGVGLYLHSGFVHMDVGPVRYWSGD